MSGGGVGFAVGRAGTLYRTVNQGHSWAPLALGVSETLHQVAITADGLHGVAIGNRGLLFVTFDTGVSWRRVTHSVVAGTNAFWTGVAFLPGTARHLLLGTAVISGQQREIVAEASDTQGINYTLTTFPHFLGLKPMAVASVANQTTVLAGGWLGKIYRRTGSGPWENTEEFLLDGLGEPDVSSVAAVAINDAGVALAATEDGNLYRSTSAGASWAYLGQSHVPGTLLREVGIGLTGSGVALLANARGEIRTASLTGSWNMVLEENEMGPLHGLTILSSGAGWATGAGGTIWHRPVRTPTTGLLTIEPASLDFGFVPFGETRARALTLFNRGVAPLTVTNLSVTGLSGTDFTFSASFPRTIPVRGSLELNVYYTPASTNRLNGSLQIRSNDPDGSQSVRLTARSATNGWTYRGNLANSSGRDVLDGQIFATGVGYALTENAIHKTGDGGVSWQSLPALSRGPLRTLHFVDSNVGFAAGGTLLPTGFHDSFIARTTNGGASWTIAFSSTTRTPVHRLRMANSTTGYAITIAAPGSVSGSVLRTVNGGTTWLVRNAPENLFAGAALAPVSAGELFVSDGPILYRSADSAETWSPVLTNANRIINDIDFSGPIGWVVGNSGTVWRTSQGGDSPSEWSRLPPLTSANLNSVHASGTRTRIGTANAPAGIFSSADAGVSWQEELANSPAAGPSPLWPATVRLFGSGEAIAFGADGSVRRWERIVTAPLGVPVAPPLLDFGQELAGRTGFRTFVIRNIGNRALTVTNLLVAGESPGNDQFRISNSLPITIAVNGSRTIGVFASNTVSGEYRVPLTILHDGQLTTTVTLRSSVVDPPRLIVLQTDPPGLPLVVNSTGIDSPATFTVGTAPEAWLPGTNVLIEAPETQIRNGQSYTFLGWSPSEDRVFQYEVPNAFATLTARYLPSTEAGMAGVGSIQGRGPISSLLVGARATPWPPGLPAGFFLRLTEATLTNEFLGKLTLQGAALLSASQIDLSVSSTGIRLPQEEELPALLHVDEGTWRFGYSNDAVRLSLQNPGIKVLNKNVVPPSVLDFGFSGTSGSFAASFALPEGIAFVPGVVELAPGNNHFSLTHTSSFGLNINGTLLAFRTNSTSWAYQQAVNLSLPEGPFHYTTPAPALSLTLPGSTTPFLALGGRNSRLGLARGNDGVLRVSLTNYQVGIMGRDLGEQDAMVDPRGRLTFITSPPANGFPIGPFLWLPDGASTFVWNSRRGSLAFHLAGGRLQSNDSAVRGWEDDLRLPGISFDSAGDFALKTDLPAFTFHGVGLGQAEEENDRFVEFKRRHGEVSLALRDEHRFFGSVMKLAFDVRSSGFVSGSFQGSFRVDFGDRLGEVDFLGVRLLYDSSLPTYQFRQDIYLWPNDYRVKFGSGGGAACHLNCSLLPCNETICLRSP